jgi:predicted Zn-dependent peptidase
MNPEITRLDNGLTVVSHEMPHLETVSLGVWVGTGARHEQPAENGISHVLEHMAFKGTSRRTARAIAEEIEEVGGELNASTSLEMTAYYARVLRGDEAVALDILADILQHSVYAPADLEREREVILQEIAGIRDCPDELAYDLLQEAAFPDQPVGRPVIGTPETVGAIAPDDLRRFLRTRYVASGIVVSAAGAIQHDELVRHASAQFGALNGGAPGEGEGASYVGGVRASPRSFEQSHLVLGFQGPSYRDEDFLTAQVYSGLMGGGMSSRLFQEVREDRGLCYAIYSSAWGLSDAGLFNVHAATGAELMAKLIDVVAREMKQSASRCPAVKEVDRAKAQLKAGLLISLESSSARAEQMARQLLVYGRLIGVRELIERVDAVTPEAVRAFAERMIGAAAPSVCVIGAGERSGHWAEHARDKLAA